MEKRKAPPVWTAFLVGALLALAVYVGLQCLLALLVAKSLLPEGAVFRCQLLSGGLAAFCGGAYAVKRRQGGMGTLPAALLPTAGLILLVMGLAIALYGRVTWDGAAAALLASMAAGGGLSALTRGKGKKKKTPAAVRRKVGKRAA